MSPLRQLLGRIGLGFALLVIVSPAVLFFLWMLSLSVKFEVDNASYPPVFIPEHFNWGISTGATMPPSSTQNGSRLISPTA